MSSTKDYTSKPDPLRNIRYVIYLTTFLYGLINLIYGPGSPPDAETPFSSTTAATAVGILQFFLAIIGITLDLTGTGKRGMVKFVLLMLSVSYVYEAVLAITSTGDPFSWAPLFVYAALCSVLYLAKD
jgi:hypothetical protein